ncbi:hypothetical protein IWX49DRAFT_600852 [Phyllosticta citricarpa]
MAHLGSVNETPKDLKEDSGPRYEFSCLEDHMRADLAAKYGHSGILEAILRYLASDLRTNTEEHPTDSDRGTRAHSQTGKDNSDKINALLEKPDHRSNSLLHKAAMLGYVDCTKLIIKYGNAKELCSMRNDVGPTPLHLAIKALLEVKRGTGKDINKTLYNQNGARDQAHRQTLLRLAVDAKDRPSVQSLVRAGANLMQTICPGDGTTILQMKVDPWRDQDLTTDDDEALVTALLENSDKLPQDVCLNILNIALERRAVGVLKSFTARWDDKDQHGWSLLDLAVQFREGSLIDLILLSRPKYYAPRWIKTDKHKDIVVSEDLIEVSCFLSSVEPRKDGIRAVRADFPIPPGMDRFYYEIEVVESESNGTLESAEIALARGHLGCKCMKCPDTGTDDDDSTMKVCTSPTFAEIAHLTDPMPSWVYPGVYCIPNNSNEYPIDWPFFKGLRAVANPTNYEENICCYTINEKTDEQ